MNPPDQVKGRRGFFRTVLMFLSLGASYGLALLFAVRYLLPGRGNRKKSRIFVSTVQELKPGDSKSFTTPDGETFLLTNTGTGISPFIAFSSRCPHLGCKVHWQDRESRFFCPCHGGAFNIEGKAVEGPPLKGNQTLKPCEIRVIGSAIYAMVERT